MTPVVKCHRCGKKGRWKLDCTSKIYSRRQGRGHSADTCPTSLDRCSRCNGRGNNADVCPSSNEAEMAVAIKVEARDDGQEKRTVQTSAFKAEETGKYGDGSGKGEQVGDEAWICDRGASTHLTPSADCVTNYLKCNLKLRIDDRSTRSIEGYGDISAVFRSGNGLVQVLFTNVAHVPDLTNHRFA